MYWLFFYDLLFGANSMILALPYSVQHISDLPFLLYSRFSPSAAIYFIIPVLLLSIMNLTFTRLYFITDLITWFLVINIHNKIYSSLTGGDYLLNQFLFFNCVLVMRTVATQHNTLKIFLHNMAIVAIFVQMSLGYFLSALTKLNDPDWLSGRAISLISGIYHFSLFSSLGLPEIILVLLNYSVIAYQALFPFLIWVTRVKKPLIIIGLIMHLYIALVMGLVGFGTVMIIAYVWFWPFETKDKHSFNASEKE